MHQGIADQSSLLDSKVSSVEISFKRRLARPAARVYVWMVWSLAPEFSIIFGLLILVGPSCCNGGL